MTGINLPFILFALLFVAASVSGDFEIFDGRHGENDDGNVERHHEEHNDQDGVNFDGAAHLEGGDFGRRPIHLEIDPTPADEGHPIVGGDFGLPPVHVAVDPIPADEGHPIVGGDFGLPPVHVAVDPIPVDDGNLFGNLFDIPTPVDHADEEDDDEEEEDDDDDDHEEREPSILGGIIDLISGGPGGHGGHGSLEENIDKIHIRQKHGKRLRRCKNKKISESKCVRGHKEVVHQFAAQDIEGNWVCTNKSESVDCKVPTCDCQAVGDPHYHTYDGQLIHYYGVCRYTLSRMRDVTHPCFFNIEVQNERRKPNLAVSYTAFVDVQFREGTFRLDQKRRATRDGLAITIPYEDDSGVKLFYSGRLLQLVHESCDIKVSFDGKSDAFVSVPKEFGGDFVGICGDCNGKKDDFRTKDGQDVDGEKNAFNLIGDSYVVPSADNPACTPAPEQPEHICDEEWEKKVREHEYCGLFIDHQGPFGACFENGAVDTEQLFDSCKIDVCIVADNKNRIIENRCEILKAVEEECSEKGFGGIDWRKAENCPLDCGSHQEYDPEMDPCQKTCATHFYGVQNDCFGLPNRSGCRCEDGYLLDGEICVLPENCKCLEAGCGDNEGFERCQKWVSEGQCQQFPALMNQFCKRSCRFCSVQEFDCEDRISTERCQDFRREGLCSNGLHKTVCGLTCNYEKCPCSPPKVNREDCQADTKISKITTTITERNYDNGVCESKDIVTYEECGDCPIIDSVVKSDCNYCTGKITVNTYTQGRNENKECFTHSSVSEEDCEVCTRDENVFNTCNNPDNVTVVHYRELIGCEACENRIDTTTTPIVCDGISQQVGSCDATTCQETTTHYHYDVENCECKVTESYTTRTCCCAESTTDRTCRNGQIIDVVTSYNLLNDNCEKEVTENVVPYPDDCSALNYAVAGECETSVCRALDTFYTYERDLNCQCKEIKDVQTRVCCCPDARVSTSCDEDAGIISQHTLSFSLNVEKNICDEQLSVLSENVECNGAIDTNEEECDYEVCKKEVAIHRIDRVGCRCVPVTETRIDDCCCIEKPYTEETCDQNRIKVYSTYNFSLDNGCEKELTSEIRVEVTCSPAEYHYGSCKEENDQFNTVTKNFVENCECKVQIDSTPLDCTCDRTPEEKVYESCSSITCTRDWSQVYYTVSEKGGCQENVHRGNEPCCCLEPSEQSNYCDTSLGANVDVNKQVIFDAEKLTCNVVITKTPESYLCEAPSVSIGECGSVDEYFYEETHRWGERNFETCSCEQREEKRLIRCKCPPSEVVEPQCIASLGQYEHKTIHYNLVEVDNNQFECEPTIEVQNEPVLCDSGEVTNTTCVDCVYDEVHTSFEIENCVCKQKVEKYQHYCCCDPQTVDKECNNPLTYTITTSHSLNADATQCITEKQVVTDIITCNESVKVIDSECQNCIYTRTTEQWGVQDCQCQLLQSDSKDLFCCCPDSVVGEYCENPVTVKQTESFTLNDAGACDKSLTVEKTPTTCPDPDQQWSECDPETNERVLVLTEHTIENCVCVPNQRVIRQVPCSCPQNLTIIRGDECLDNVKTTIIQKYVLKDDACVYEDLVVVGEACGDKGSITELSCIDGDHYLINITDFILASTGEILGFKISEFVVQGSLEEQPIVCDESTTRSTECVDYEKCLITSVWAPVNCTCEKEEQTHSCEACNCHEKDYSDRLCSGDRWHHVIRKFSSGAPTCTESVEDYDEPIVCEPAESIVNYGPCLNNGVDGYYRVVQIALQSVENCDCKTTIIEKDELCDCLEETSAQECINNVDVSTTVLTYTRVENSCVPRKTITTTTTDCGSPKLDQGVCDLDSCTVTFELLDHSIQNCQCQEQRSAATQLCCAPPPKVNEYCENGAIVTETTTYTLVDTEQLLFPNIPDVFVKVVRDTTTTVRLDVVCSRNERKDDTCDEESGILTRVIHFDVESNCECVEQNVTETSYCRCAETEDRADPCRDDCVQTGAIIRHLLIDGKCVDEPTAYERSCCCQNDEIREYCDETTGENVRIVTKYHLTPEYTCQADGEETRSTPLCPREERKVWSDECNAETHLQTRVTTYNEYSSASCTCEPKEIRESLTCSCPVDYEDNHHCVDDHVNSWTKVTFTYLPDTFECTRNEVEENYPISCAETSDSIDVCREDGYQTVTIVLHEARNCSCKEIVETREDICDCSKIPDYAERSETVCLESGNAERTTRVYYNLIDGICEPQVEISVKEIVCPSDPQTVVGDCFESCDHSIVSTDLTVANCACQRVVVNQIAEKCCCPSEEHVNKYCENNQIVDVFEYYELESGACVRNQRTTREDISCPAEERYTPVCADASSCEGELVKEVRGLEDCVCDWRLASTAPIKCCCDPDQVISECIEGVQITTAIVNTLENHECIQNSTVQRYDPNCEALSCYFDVSSCQNNIQERTKYCYRNENCKCEEYKDSVSEERCGCDPDLRDEDGECHDDCSQVIQHISKVFNPDTKECDDKLESETTVQCCCSSNSQSSECIDDTVIKTTFVNYNLVNKYCVEEVTVESKTIEECTLEHELVSLTTSECDEATRLRTITKVYKFAKDCSCHTETIPVEEICSCEPPTVTDKCENDISKVRITGTYSLADGVCNYQETIDKSDIDCPIREWSERIPCEIGVEVTKRIFKKQYPQNCECIIETVREVDSPCVCKDLEKKEWCDLSTNANNIEVTTWTLNEEADSCEEIKAHESFQVDCEVGDYEVVSECDTYTNTYSHTVGRRWLETCECQDEGTVTECDCSCPPDTTQTVCQNYLFTTTNEVYTVENCKCRKNIYVQEIVPECPTIEPVTIGECVRTDNIGTQVVTHRSLLQNTDECTCSVVVEEHQEVCWCSEEQKVEEQCSDNYHRTTTSVFTLVNGNCDWVVTSEVTVEIKCPHEEVSVVCDDEIGEKTITTVSYANVNCSCEKQTTIEKATCPCNPDRDLIEERECQADCYQEFVYSFLVFRDDKCQEETEIETRRCCCPGADHTRTCDGDVGQWIDTKLSYQFTEGRCIPNSETTYDVITCDTQPKRSEECNSETGVKVITITAERQQDCECKVDIVEVVEKRCSCDPSSVTVTCEVDLARFKTVEITQTLIDDACPTFINTTYQDVPCVAPEGTQVCNDESGVYTITEFSAALNENCECVVTSNSVEKRCKCDETVTVTEACNENGERVVTTSKIELTENHECKPVESVQIIPVPCNERTWDVPETDCSDDGTKVIHHLTTQKVGCECTQTQTDSTCACACSPQETREECVDNVLVTTTYAAGIENCTCQQYPSESRKDTDCPQPKTTYGECGATETCVQVVEIVIHNADNCQCIPITEYRNELCCCSPDRLVERECSVIEGIETTITTTWTLVDGQCVATVERDIVSGFCRPQERRETDGVCDPDTGLQKWTLFTASGVGCDCIVTESSYYTVCSCKPDRKVEEECDVSTCLQKLETVGFTLQDGKCEPNPTIVEVRQCCCLRDIVLTESCIDNRLIQNKVVYSFNEEIHECNKVESTTDISLDCGLAHETNVGECDFESGLVEIIDIYRSWEECQCTESSTVSFGKCTCDDDTTDKSCVDNKWQIILTTHRLSNYECIPSQVTEVQPITCNEVPEVSVEECDLLTCKRKISTKTQVLTDCNCVDVIEDVSETCCCSSNVREYNYCNDNHDRVFVTESESFDADLKVCVQETKAVLQPTECDSIGSITYGTCSIENAGRFYQTVSRHFSVVFGCDCIDQVEETQQLCACGDEFTDKVCVDGIEVTYKHTFELVVDEDNNRDCGETETIVDSHDPQCSNRNHDHWSECDAATCLKTYQQFVYTENNCDCAEVVSTVDVPCCCPLSTEEKTCLGNRILIETTSFNLVCTSPLECQCVPSLETREEFVNCPDTVIEEAVCDGRTIVSPYKATFYVLNNCECESKTYTSTNSSSCSDSKCRDNLSHQQCVEAYEAGFCQSDSLIHNSACRKTCGNCCEKENKKFLVIPGKSLKTCEILDGFYLINKLIFSPTDASDVEEICKQKCLDDTLCQSFEIKVNATTLETTCYFNNANTKQIYEQTNGEHGLVEDPNSKVYIVYCECDKPDVKVIDECQCYEQLVSGEKVCDSTVQVTVHEPNENGECIETVTTQKTTCNGPCRDVTDKITCDQYRDQQQCGNEDVKAICKETCGYCDCSGKVVQETDCIDNKKTVITIIHKKGYLDLCFTDTYRTEEPCVPVCIPGEYENPGPCIDGERTVYIDTITRVNGQCLKETVTRKEDCAGCCPSVKLTPQRDCTNGYRVVTREWWAREGDCCRQQRFNYQQRCDGCAEVSLSHGECAHGFQVSYTTWGEHINNDTCEQRVDASIDAC